MAEYDIAVCMTVRATDEDDARKKVSSWLTNQALPKWAIEHEVSDAREAN